MFSGLVFVLFQPDSAQIHIDELVEIESVIPVTGHKNVCVLDDEPLSFRPLARKVVVYGNKDAKLPGFRIVEKAEEADLAWVTEGYDGDGAKLRKKLDARKVPLISTHVRIEGAVDVRPDPRGVGLQLAARLLKAARTGVLPPEGKVTRHRVVVDIDLARAAGYQAPLALLARADVVRRRP